MGKKVPLLVPELKASPLRLSVWFVEEGEEVFVGDRLVELLVEGATFDVVAPVYGRLEEKLAWPDLVLFPGQILGYIETNENEEDVS